MADPIGSAVPIGLPGGVTGYFQVLRPAFDKFEVPGVEMHPSLITALRTGAVTLKYGILVGRDKTDTVASGVSQTRFKIVVKTLVNAWEVLQSNVVGGIHPVFNNGYDPGVQGAGRIAIPFMSWYDAQHGTLDPAYVTAVPAVGDLLTAGVGGQLNKAVTGDRVVGEVIEAIMGAQGFNGSDSQTVVTARFKGTDVAPWLAP